MPGWGFGYLSGVLIDSERAGPPAHAGTLSWGGVYGHSWFLDPVAGLSVVGLTNTALERLHGLIPSRGSGGYLRLPRCQLFYVSDHTNGAVRLRWTRKDQDG